MILMSSLIGGGGLPQLAPDLTFPADISQVVSGVIPIKSVVGIDGSVSPATVISLSGKWEFCAGRFLNMTNESYTVTMTVDGEDIFNTAVSVTGGALPIFGSTSTSSSNDSPIQCNSSLLITIESTTDTSVDFQYLARPIL